MDHESAYEKPRAAPAERQAPAAPWERPAREEPSLVEQVVGSGIFESLARSAGARLGREITRSLSGTARRGR